jgi:ribonuclease D
MVFPESISKEAIKELPLLTFKGTLHVIDQPEMVGQAVHTLKQHYCVGFDTEKKPTFQKGAYNPTALVQLSTSSDAYLFRINKTGFHRDLISILSDESILKIGVGIRDDLEDLKKLQNFNPGGFVELIDLTKELGIQNSGVRNLSGIFLKKRVSKNQQTSNWENETLTKAQQLYAAADAWVPFEIYTMLEEKGFLYNE